MVAGRPPKDMCISQHLEPQNETLFGKRIFADVMEWRVWDEVLLDEGDTTSNDRVLLRDRRGETQTQKGSHVKTEAETGGMWPQAQGLLEPPEAGRGGKDPPLEPLEGLRPRDTLTSDVWSPGWGRINISCVKPLGLWSLLQQQETDTPPKRI